MALAAAENAAAKMTVKVLRADSGIAAGTVRALEPKGSPIGEAHFSFGLQDRETEAAFDLPVELRNDIARLEISGERSAGAVQLLDKRWRRRAIGIVSGSSSDTAQPLLASTFYLTRALAPFADVRLGDKGAPQQAITQFLDQKLPMIVHGRCRNAVAGNARTAQRLDRPGRRAGALRRPPAGASRRRPRAGQAAQRRPHPRRQPDLGEAAASRSLRRRRPVRRRSRCRRTSPSTARCWPSPMRCSRPRAGLRSKTARRSSPASAAARDWSACSMSAPICAGPTCRCRAPSSKCCGGSSICPATPPSPARALPARPPRRRWRRCARSTASAPSARRPRPQSRCRPIIATAPRWIIRPGFYGPADGPLAVNTLAAADRIAPLDTSALARAARELHQCRAARPARHPALGFARTVPDRRDHRGRLARRRHRRPVAAARGTGRAALWRCCRRPGVAAFVRPRRQSRRRFRDEGDVADPARLCRHRQCRRRFHRQGRHVRADAVSRAAHGAGGRRSRRHRSRA